MHLRAGCGGPGNGLWLVIHGKNLPAGLYKLPCLMAGSATQVNGLWDTWVLWSQAHCPGQERGKPSAA